MFTVYGIYPDGREDNAIDCGSIDDAMSCLRKMISSDMCEPGGPLFSRYGLCYDRSVAEEAMYRMGQNLQVLNKVLSDHNIAPHVSPRCWSALNELRLTLDSLPQLHTRNVGGRGEQSAA